MCSPLSLSSWASEISPSFSIIISRIFGKICHCNSYCNQWVRLLVQQDYAIRLYFRVTRSVSSYTLSPLRVIHHTPIVAYISLYPKHFVVTTASLRGNYRAIPRQLPRNTVVVTAETFWQSKNRRSPQPKIRGSRPLSSWTFRAMSGGLPSSVCTQKHKHNTNLADCIVHCTDYIVVIMKNLAENPADILLMAGNPWGLQNTSAPIFWRPHGFMLSFLME